MLSEDNGASGNATAIPDNGEWISSALSFELDEKQILTIEFDGFGCVGPTTAAGIPVCDSLLSGPVTVNAPFQGGTFSFGTVFGLQLEGTFVASNRLEGSFVYEADNGCCVQEGTWEAVHEALAEVDPPALCHSDISGEEQLEIGNTAEEGAYIPLEEGGTVEAVAGFQGAIMIVAGLQGVGFALGDLATELEAYFPESGVRASVIAEKNEFEENEDGTVSWVNLWLILEDESGSLLSPINQADIDLISGQEVEITATVYNTCGFQLQRKWNGILNYSP